MASYKLNKPNTLDPALYDDDLFYSSTKASYDSQIAAERFKGLLLPIRKKQLRDQFEFFLSLLPERARVLDVGCGTGKDVGIMLSLGFQSTGIDFSPTMIEIARQEVGDHFAQLDVLDLETLPEASYDGVSCIAILQHVSEKDIDHVFSGIRHILRRPGYIFIFTKRGKGRTWDDRLGEYYKRGTVFYGVRALEKRLIVNNFAIVKTSKFRLIRQNRPDNWLTIIARIDNPE